MAIGEAYVIAQEKVFETLAQGPLRRQEIIAASGLGEVLVTNALRMLEDRKRIRRIARGVYEVSNAVKPRYIRDDSADPPFLGDKEGPLLSLTEAREKGVCRICGEPSIERLRAVYDAAVAWSKSRESLSGDCHSLGIGSSDGAEWGRELARRCEPLRKLMSDIRFGGCECRGESIVRRKRCPECNATGSAGINTPCPECRGEGYVEPCPKCHGWKLYGGEPCDQCKGEGYVP